MRKIIIGSIVVIIVVIGIAVWNGSGTKISTPAKPLKIGLIAGLSGQYAFIGENYKKGILLANEIYAKNNPERKVEVIVEDDQFDPKKGLSAYKKLTEIDKIDGLINMTSPTINSIYGLVSQVGLPVIQGGEQGQEPTNDNVFQMMPGNISVEEELGKYVKGLNYQNTAVFYSNDPTFLRFFEAFQKGYGGNFDSYKLNPADKDINTVVVKALSTKPGAFVFITMPDQGALVVKETAKLSKGVKLPMVFDPSFQTGFSDYKRILGDLSILDGSKVMTIKQTSSESFKTAYKQKYNEEPGVAADLAFDSFNVLINSYDEDRKSWIDAISRANFEGASGAVVFDEAGVRKPQYEMKIVANGSL